MKTSRIILSLVILYGSLVTIALCDDDEPTPTPTSIISPTPIAGDSPTATPTPNPGSTPPPPALNNPQNPIAYGADPTGVNDSWPAFQAALHNGDLDIRAGTYLLNAVYGSDGYFVPNGRNVYCENQVLPPTPNSPVVLKVPAAPTGWFNLFYEWSNGTLYGCEVEGYHYPNTTWSNDTNGGAGDSFVLLFSASNFNAYNNSFDGWQGTTAPIAMNVASPAAWSQSKWPSNINISYNRFSNCNVRGVEVDYGRNVRITHNTYVDCPQLSEIQDWHWTGMSVLTDSNTFTFTHGSYGGVTNGWGNMASSGAVCVSAVSSSSTDDRYCPTLGSELCDANCPSDYSGNTFSNNTVTTTAGSSVTPYLVENLSTCNGYPDGSIAPAVYRNNTCSGNCSRLCPPGNSNANSWGAGSNQ